MTDDFTTDGALAQAIKGLKPREVQRLMTQTVTETINFKQELVVEGGDNWHRQNLHLLGTCATRPS